MGEERTEEIAEQTNTESAGTDESSQTEKEATLLGKAGGKDESTGEEEEAGKEKQEGTEKTEEEIEYSDFELPEGFEAGEAMDEFKAMAKELGLSQEKAQGLVGLGAKLVQSQQDRMYEDHAKTVRKWVDDVKADPEIGGRNFGESIERANRALTKFGSDALTELLVDSGFANHPEVVRLFANIDKATGEDQSVGGNDAAESANAEDVLYKDMGKK